MGTDVGKTEDVSIVDPLIEAILKEMDKCLSGMMSIDVRAGNVSFQKYKPHLRLIDTNW